MRENLREEGIQSRDVYTEPTGVPKKKKREQTKWQGRCN